MRKSALLHFVWVVSGPETHSRPFPHVNACEPACEPENATRGFWALPRRLFSGTDLVMRDFDHRQLDAYRVAVEFVTHADTIAVEARALDAGDEMLRRIVSMLTKMVLRTMPPD